MDDKFELERVIMSLSREIEDVLYRVSIIEESMARLFAEMDQRTNKREEPDSEEEIGYA